MAQRTFKADVEKIEKLRIKKGFALPDLAVEACVSNRTIDSIMLGHKVVISTISKVAKALGVTPDFLLLDYQPEPHSEPAQRTEIAARHREAFTEFDQCELSTLIEALHAMLGADVAPTAVEDGGRAIITLSIDREHLRALLYAFIDSKLAAFNIDAMKFKVVGGQAGNVGLQFAALSGEGKWFGPEEEFIEDAVCGRIELFGQDGTRL